MLCIPIYGGTINQNHPFHGSWGAWHLMRIARSIPSTVRIFCLSILYSIQISQTIILNNMVFRSNGIVLRKSTDVAVVVWSTYESKPVLIVTSAFCKVFAWTSRGTIAADATSVFVSIVPIVLAQLASGKEEQNIVISRTNISTNYKSLVCRLYYRPPRSAHAYSG